MFRATIVVFGCGNILFGDDGLAPKAVSALAEESARTGAYAHVAFIDAGTSIRPLLLDMTLCPSKAQKIIVVDVVQEADRPAGSIQQKILGSTSSSDHNSDVAGGFLHHAPTGELLRRLHINTNISVVLLTVQAAHIPVLMDDSLSPEALTALPTVIHCIRQLCTLPLETEYS